jgi:pSer/pThr/pTyr-binding forkhead associated (FHA) protein
MATLTVTSGPAEGRKIECKGEVVVGREGVDFVVDDDQMSRRHAAIRMGPSGVEIEDLGSLNGTFVDGERISTADLHDGSTITVGRSRLTFRLGLR